MQCVNVPEAEREARLHVPLSRVERAPSVYSSLCSLALGLVYAPRNSPAAASRGLYSPSPTLV